jgi:ribosome-associated protein YbcJ (S4-like RNA binding protein)
MVQSGGEAKFVIAEELVRVNGEVETRKRKKSFRAILLNLRKRKFELLPNENVAWTSQGEIG